MPDAFTAEQKLALEERLSALSENIDKRIKEISHKTEIVESNSKLIERDVLWKNRIVNFCFGGLTISALAGAIYATVGVTFSYLYWDDKKVLSLISNGKDGALENATLKAMDKFKTDMAGILDLSIKYKGLIENNTNFIDKAYNEIAGKKSLFDSSMNNHLYSLEQKKSGIFEKAAENEAAMAAARKKFIDDLGRSSVTLSQQALAIPIFQAWNNISEDLRKSIIHYVINQINQSGATWSVTAPVGLVISVKSSQECPSGFSKAELKYTDERGEIFQLNRAILNSNEQMQFCSKTETGIDLSKSARSHGDRQ